MTYEDRGLIDPVAIATQLKSGADALPILRAALTAATEHLRQRFLSGASTHLLIHQRAWAIDQVLTCAWSALLGEKAASLCLVAVGGYGRGELHPGSDIDILILLPKAHDSALQPKIAQFVTLLWDVGLQIGQSVRTVDECVAAAADITVATNLMESRLLCGDHLLFEEMQRCTGPDHLWPSRQFFEAKWQEQIARHRKYHDAVSNLEPNVKEGPGGLRDIQMIGWVAKRHFGAATLHDLVQYRFLTEKDYETLMVGQEFLWKVRLTLHTLTGRREDRLLFDFQKSLAQQFGYQDTRHRMAVEHFMKDYYVTIMELNRLNEMLLQLFQEAILYADEPVTPVPINRRFQARKGFIEAVDRDVFRRYPFAILEVFLLLQHHPELLGVRASTVRLIRDHRHLIDDEFRKDMRNKSLFMEILREPCGITRQLRRMNRYGILAQYIPAFGKVVGLMQYDLFHVYTVDEHTLMVLRNVRRFTLTEHAHEHPFCHKLIQQVPKLEILYLGALFHDIAKGRGGDHSNLGAQEAYDFCIEHGMSVYDGRLVSWLVRNHLIMSSTAQRQDISDPSVIAHFARQVGDQIHLNYLYLLTVADIRGTSPELWNNWKDALLTELYIATARALRRGLENPIDKNDRIEEVQNVAAEQIKGAGVAGETIADVWKRFDEDYFLRHTADEIAWHTQAIAQSQSQDLPLILTRNDADRGATAIFVYTQDKDFLFASATQTLDDLNLDIQDARIITTKAGFVLDTFLVLDSAGEPLSDPYQIAELCRKLKAAVANPMKRAVLSHRPMPRRLKHFSIATEISFSTDLHNQRTILEVVAGDRPGFLSLVGQSLAECEARLHSAKISTFGERVEDVFFITDLSNKPLTEEKQFNCLRNSIRERLDEGRY